MVHDGDGAGASGGGAGPPGGPLRGEPAGPPGEAWPARPATAATPASPADATGARIAVLIKTLEREEALLACLRSVRVRLAEQGIGYRVYLADDGPVSAAKREAYRVLREEGHRVLELDREVGASRARNLLVERLEEEPWVLRMDDDFELTGETDVRAMRAILEQVPELGAVADLERQIGHGKGVFSGGINPAQGFFRREGDALVSDLRPPRRFDYERAGGYRFARCDFTRNLLLIRREVLETVRWEERLPFAREHEDFLLQLAGAGWEVAFTPDSIHRHRDDLAARGRSPGKAERRRMRREALRVFEEKWGIRRRKVRRPWPDTLRAPLVRARRELGRLPGVPP